MSPVSCHWPFPGDAALTRAEKKGVVPILTVKRATLALALAATVLTGTALPSFGLDIYEPDSPYNEAPNTLLSVLPQNADEFEVKVSPRGAELVTANPKYANAVVTIGKDKRFQSEVYVRLNRVVVLKGDDGSMAESIAAKINTAFAMGRLRADRIVPGRRNNQYAIMLGREPLITIDAKLASAQGARPATLTMKWMDNLRTALGGRPFAQVASRGGMFISGSAVGHASWYGPGFHGRRAASGERFDQNALTAAHKTLPFGTLVLITNLRNKQSVIVRINDRGPYIPGRQIDLSAAAARSVGISGVGRVRMDILKP